MDPRWPSTSEALLLRAALLDGTEAGDAWREWRRSRGLDEMDVPSLRLVPLIYRNLGEDPESEGLKQIYLESWRRTQRLLRSGAGALTALADAGVETMVLKGAALATLYYPDVGARPMVDFDVLVHAEDASSARETLEAAGWRGGPAATVLHSTPLSGPGGERVDLHWRALDQPARDDDFWEAARPIEVGGAATLAPGPAEQLLHVCAHGLGVSPATLRWVADAVMVTRHSDLDWDRVVERTIARRLTLDLLPALRYLRASFGVHVPDEALARLERSPLTTTDRLLQRAAWGRHRHWRFAAHAWDRYRRLRSGGLDSPASDGFLSYLAAQLGFPSRKRMLAYFARRIRRGCPRSG